MSQTATRGERSHADYQLPYILALDIGTSSVRALLFDATGRALPHVQSQIPYELTTSIQGESSVEADPLVELVARTIDGVLAAAGDLASPISPIAAVATDTFWHSLIAVDKANHALTPVLIWEDTRARQAVAELCQQLDPQAIHQRTGARLHTSYWPAKLRWLATAMPHSFKKAAQLLSFGEYLHRRFLGKSVCSLSMASGTGMLATRARAWDDELQRVLGVQPEQLPPVGDLRDSVQGLLPEFASRWPALRDVPWFPAIGDGAAANAGSGCASEENWALTIGTSSAIRVVVPPDEVVPSGGLWLYLLDARRGLLGGALSEGGNLLAWLEATLKLPPLTEAEALIAALPPDGHGLTILPFITGERSPGWHSEAAMDIIGLNAHTTPADILRASLEAIAYQLSMVYDELLQSTAQREVAPTLVGSGGALFNSPTLQELLANTLNTPLYPSLEREASARGAALLALESLDIVSDVAHVPVKLEAPVLPEESLHAIYQLGAERQKRLYQVHFPHQLYCT